MSAAAVVGEAQTAGDCSSLEKAATWLPFTEQLGLN